MESNATKVHNWILTMSVIFPGLYRQKSMHVNLTMLSQLHVTVLNGMMIMNIEFRWLMEEITCVEKMRKSMKNQSGQPISGASFKPRNLLNMKQGIYLLNCNIQYRQTLAQKFYIYIYIYISCLTPILRILYFILILTFIALLEQNY
jgi:hypothetical protein